MLYSPKCFYGTFFTHYRYGKDVYHQLRQAFSKEKLVDFEQDEHAKIMEGYADVKEWMYLTYFAIMVLGAILVCEFTPFYMQWWLTIVCILVGVTFTLPVGIIQAVTGFQPGLNILTQVISGLIVPGQTSSVMAFKTMGYDISIQALNLSGDLKLGYYMHISPLAMIASQLIGTVIGSVFMTIVAFMVMVL